MEITLEDTLYFKIGNWQRVRANHLIGELCTLADSTMEEGKRLEAFKDMIKSLVWGVESCRTSDLSMLSEQFIRGEISNVFLPETEAKIRAGKD